MSKTVYLLVVITTLLLGGCKLSVENSGGGIVTSDDGKIKCGEVCEADYDSASTVTLVATPDPGYVFNGWEGACSGNDTCSMSIDNKDVNVSASFALKPLPSDIAINTSTFDIKLAPEDTSQLSTSLNFSAGTSSTPSTISISQKVVALWGENDGIRITPVISDTFIASADTNKVYIQDISSFDRGLYEVTTTAEILETGDIASTVTRISVQKKSPPVLALSEPASYPGILSPNTLSSILFTTKARFSDRDTPIEVTLTGDVSLTLNDDGIEGDMKASDGTYSGVLEVDSVGYGVDSCLVITASAQQGELSTTSDAMELCISPLPAQFSNSDISDTNLIVDLVSGSKIISDELMMKVYDGLSPEEIYSIAANVNAEIVGAMPETNIYQLHFNASFYDISELEQVIEILEQNKNVVSASTHDIVTTLQSAETAEKTIPNDYSIDNQYRLHIINAPQAWSLAIGAATIAVVDSGVDFTHPDLSSKVIKGLDFVDDDFYPDDKNGHGTHVAGIAAAETDNKIGIAGVSWESSILAVRILNELGEGSSTDTANAIRYAAASGARIINVSAGSYGGELEKCAAVSYASSKGSIVVAAAGNDSTDKKFYPAACPGAVSVGNTDFVNTKSSQSNFGSWVDLAAPGVMSYSTVPEGTAEVCENCSPSGYKHLSGTSMSAPVIAGALAVVMDREPGFSNSEALARLKDTAVPLPDQGLGAGRIDLYEAMFPPSQLITNVIFDDENFRTCVLDQASLSGLVYIDDVSYLSCRESEINNIKGIEAFTELTTLDISHNNLTTLDLSSNLQLRSVYVKHNKLTNLVLGNLSKLERLYIYFNNLTHLDVSNSPELNDLRVDNNNLAELVLGNHPKLVTLNAQDNNLTKIDLSNTPVLSDLTVSDNSLINLDVSNIPELSVIRAYNNNLDSLDFSNNPLLGGAQLSNNHLTNINISNNLLLEVLTIANNNLSSIDVTNNHLLKILTIENNNLSSIDVSTNSELSHLNASNNNLSVVDISNNTVLNELWVMNNNLVSLDVSNHPLLTRLNLNNNNLSSVDISNATALTRLELENNNLSNLDLTSNTALNALLLDNNNFSDIDLSSNVALETLELTFNELSSINLDGNLLLRGVWIRYNPLSNSAADYLDNLQQTRVDRLYYCSTIVRRWNYSASCFELYNR